MYQVRPRTRRVDGEGNRSRWLAGNISPSRLRPFFRPPASAYRDTATLYGVRWPCGSVNNDTSVSTSRTFSLRPFRTIMPQQKKKRALRPMDWPSLPEPEASNTIKPVSAIDCAKEELEIRAKCYAKRTASAYSSLKLQRWKITCIFRRFPGTPWTTSATDEVAGHSTPYTRRTFDESLARSVICESCFPYGKLLGGLDVSL